MSLGIWITFGILMTVGPTVLRATKEWRQEIRNQQWEEK